MFYIKKHIASLTAMLVLSAVIVSGINVSSDTDAVSSGERTFSNSAGIKQLSNVNDEAAEPLTAENTVNDNNISEIKTDSPAFDRMDAGDVRPKTDDTAIQRFMNITSGTTIHDTLSNSAGENIYSFSLGRRGAITYTFSQESPTSAKLRISLYQDRKSTRLNASHPAR